MVGGIGALSGCIGELGSTETSTETPSPTVVPKSRAREEFRIELRAPHSVRSEETFTAEVRLGAPPKMTGLYGSDDMNTKVEFFFEGEDRGFDTVFVPTGEWKSEKYDFEVNVYDPGEYEFRVDATAFFKPYQVLKTVTHEFTINK